MHSITILSCPPLPEAFQGYKEEPGPDLSYSMTHSRKPFINGAKACDSQVRKGLLILNFYLPSVVVLTLTHYYPQPQSSISLLEESRGGTESLSYPIWSLVAQMEKNPPAMQETWVQPLGQEDPLEKGMATHSCILIWRIPWTEGPGRIQSMESQRIRYD